MAKQKCYMETYSVYVSNCMIVLP